MPRKILIFSTAYLPFVGGAEVAIKEIAERLSGDSCPSGRRVGFDMITARLKRNLPGTEKIGNIVVYRIGFGIPMLDKLLLPFWGAWKAKQLSQENQYHAFWCMMISWASGAAYLANIFSNKKTPIVLTLQEGDSESHLTYRWLGFLNLSWKLALKYATEVTAISSYLAERARRLGYERKVQIVPNGVDADSYNQIFSDQELTTLHEKMIGHENVIILMSTSRLVAKNGLDLVIKALPLLPENVHFYNFGSGKEKKSLMSLAKTLGVQSRLHLENYVEHDQLPQYLKVANIFVRPSRSEGQGISFLEAMAAKIPVIATPVGGIVDFLESGKTGYFCEPENPQSIADAVNRALNDSGKDQIVDNAYKMVCERYDWSNIAMQMKGVFDNISQL